MTSTHPQSVWLITGASAGLGLATTLSALQAGHRVIACARNPTKAAQDHPEVRSLGGEWIKLDVSTSGAQQAVQEAIRDVGRIDVVVNNAGVLGTFGAMEDISETEFHDVMNTNFYGAMRVVRGALPVMRAQRSGTVIQISSTSGIVGSPANSSYCASKFALDGFSESLALEVQPFNIRVVLIVAGQFDTSILSKATPAAASADYQEPALQGVMGWVERVKAYPEGKRGGDPSKFGHRLVEIADGKGLGEGLGGFLRFPLGEDALEMCRRKAQRSTEDCMTLSTIAASTGYHAALTR